MVPRWYGPLLGVLVTLLCTPALAHPQLDDAIVLARDAEFESALEAFERALASHELTRDELLELLSERILVHQAVRDLASLERDLLRLAALDPEHDLGPNAPPDLRERWRAAAQRSRGPLGLQVRARAVAGGVRVEAELTGGIEGVAFPLQIALRAPGGTWLRTNANQAVYPVPVQGVAEYYVLAMGPGGVVVASDGTPASPRRLEVERAPAPSALPQPEPATEPPPVQPARTRLWIGVGAGGAVAVGTAVLIAVLAGRGERDSRIGSPDVDF